MVQTWFSPTQAEYCSGRMLIFSFRRAWLSFFLFYMGTMSLFGPWSWRALYENSSVVDPRIPSLTTNTDSCHGLPRPSPQLQKHSSPTTLHNQHWAHDTYHFSCLAFSGVCSSSCVSYFSLIHDREKEKQRDRVETKEGSPSPVGSCMLSLSIPTTNTRSSSLPVSPEYPY